MVKRLRRVVKRSEYDRDMRSTAIEPVRRDPQLDEFVGMWVAVKNGHVVATAYNSRDLVPMIHDLGRDGVGAVAQFVPPRDDSVVIGVG